jgi:hypothetical protein
VGVLALAPSPSHAGLVYSGSNGNLSGSAHFSLSGNTLTVILTDTTTTPVSDNGSTLGGVFFNTTTPLTAVSAALTPGSFIANGSIVNNVGEGWLYAHPVGGTAYNSEIASVGYTVGFGDSAAQPFFNPPVTPLDGADYSLVGTGGIMPNGGLKSPLFQNSLTFRLTVGQGFSLSELGNSVRLQFGTSLSETSITTGPPSDDSPAVPEPATIIAALSGILPLGLVVLRRRLRQPRSA